MNKVFVLLLLLCASTGAQAQTSGTVNQGVNGQVGTQTTEVGGQQVGLQIQGGQPVAPLTNVVSPGLLGPQIFGPLGNTPGSASVPFIAAANKLCNVKYTRNSRPSTKPEEKTESGQTRIIFSAYTSLISKEKSGVLVDEIIPPDLAPGIFEKSVCLGTLTVMTKESAGSKTDFAVVQNDAMEFLFEKLRGYRKVVLVSLITSVSAASGVSSDATSFGLGGIFGHLVSLVTTAGLGPSFTKGSGSSNPTNFPGGTFLVLAVEEEAGQTIDTGQLSRFFFPQQTTNGTPPSAVKSEVLKQ